MEAFLVLFIAFVVIVVGSVAWSLLIHVPIGWGLYKMFRRLDG